MKYYYLAFVPAGDSYAIFSPDFPEITSQGNDVTECMEMGEDALRITVQEYARAGKALPEPASLGACREYMTAFLQELETVPTGEILYQLFAAPVADMTPVKISATFTRYALDIIDRKARERGMTRSGFLAHVALKA